MKGGVFYPMGEILIGKTSAEYNRENGRIGYKALRQSIGLDANSHQSYWRDFNRYQFIFPQNEMSGLITRVFFTRPDFNLFSDIDGKKLVPENSMIHEVQYMNQFHNTILNGLTSNLDQDHDFIPWLTDRVTSIQLKDYELKNYEFTQMYTGYKTVYGGNAVESNSGGEMTIEFRDDRDTRLTKFFHTWIHLISEENLNGYTPKRKYIEENRFDYHTSIYVLQTMPDDNAIVNFYKFTGAIPLNAPHSTYSHSQGTTPSPNISVSFSYSHFRAFDPAILIDFNMNSRRFGTPLERYDSLYSLNGVMAGAPYIGYRGNSSSCEYYLAWNSPKY